MPKTCKPFCGLLRYIYVPGRFLVQVSNLKENTMKQLIAIIATVAAATAFAQTTAPAVKPAPAATAPAAGAPAAKKEEPKKADTKSAPAGDKKAEAPKK